ncbi:MAG: hypothetical protein M1420_00850 [Actinobacteria bacterium]|nr:hypothetical protein [Actinomycetota bacterium]
MLATATVIQRQAFELLGFVASLRFKVARTLYYGGLYHLIDGDLSVMAH